MRQSSRICLGLLPTDVENVQSSFFTSYIDQQKSSFFGILESSRYSVLTSIDEEVTQKWCFTCVWFNLRHGPQSPSFSKLSSKMIKWTKQTRLAIRTDGIGMKKNYVSENEEKRKKIYIEMENVQIIWIFISCRCAAGAYWRWYIYS